MKNMKIKNYDLNEMSLEPIFQAQARHNLIGNYLKEFIMSYAKPFVIGSAFSITVGLGYTSCAIAFAISPSLAVSFTTDLFHGLNFSTMQSGAGGFSFSSFFVALLVLMAWAFALGAIYSAIYYRLARKRADKVGMYTTSSVSPGRA
jgi:hypothetical protein